MTEVIGVTLNWALLPTRLFRFKDGFVGIIHGDRRLHPECYGPDGWPINPVTGERYPIYLP